MSERGDETVLPFTETHIYEGYAVHDRTKDALQIWAKLLSPVDAFLSITKKHTHFLPATL